MSGKNPRVLTGLQPSGSPHLGNYFGAIKPAIELSRQYELFLFLADYHILNTNQPADINRKNCIDLAATLVACGFDYTKNVLYAQSAAPQVHELAWVLACQSPFGLMTRAHSFKDKQAKGLEVNCGLFNYPILMAADILLYDADKVPVGKDQKQHLEITRDLAQRFNHMYGETFVLPEPLISEDVGVVPGTDGEKMSKSKDNVISIFASDKVWKQQVMGIKTDSKELEEPKDPATCNVYALYKLLATPEEAETVAVRYRQGNYGYGHAKMALLDKLKEHFGPARERYESLRANPEQLLEILGVGARRVSGIANEKLARVQETVGLLGRSVWRTCSEP